MSSKESNKVNVSLITLVSATGIGVFMGALDSSIVNISLKTIEDSFRVDQSSVQWVVLAYLLTIISLMTVSGNLGDRFSSKKVFQLGIGLFTLGSLLCGLSPTLEILVISRIFQAFGASGLFANGIAIITRFTDRKNRGLAIGFNSLIVSGALTVGPAVGGILTQFFGWQSIFFMNIPIGIVGFVWVQKVIPSTPPLNNYPSNETSQYKIDILGIILLPVTLFALTAGFAVLNNKNTLEILPIAILLFLLSFIAFIVLIYVEKRAPNPNIDLSLFKNRRFTAGIISAILAFTGLQIILYQMPFFLQDRETMNLTQSETGLIIIAVPLVMAIAGPLAGRLSDKYDAKYLSTGGIIGIAMVLLVFTLVLSKSIDIFVLILLMLLFGLTIGFFSAPNGNSVMSASPRNKLGLAGGILALSRNIGFTLGIVVSTAVLTLFTRFFSNIYGTSLFNPDGTTRIDPNVYVSSLQWIFMLSIPFLLTAALISYLRGSEERSIS
ncbi:MAG: putative transport protein HsrA [Candidatus Heimdallarchaeota archaeon LC_3]|nr:MAG: putative transport protein HsrA [Candidatus Heimdallarchaeota archaeon LC_3]